MIVVFGDSIAVGHLDTQGGWVNRLNIYFINKYLQGEIQETVSVHNFSISGGTTNDLPIRGKQDLECILWGNPRIVIVALGTNDSAHDMLVKQNLVDKDTFRKNIEDFIDVARGYQPTIVYMFTINAIDQDNTYPVPWDETVGYTTNSVKEYNLILEDICTTKECVLIDCDAVITQADLVDGVHPNSNGHEKIYSEVLRAIEPYFVPFS